MRLPINKTALRIAMTGLAMVAVPAFAQAQFAPDSRAPISGSSDTAQYAENVTILTGQVDIRQGETRILADRMEIYSASSGGQAGAFDNVSRIVAEGNFFYITPEQEVSGQGGVYEQADDTFTVTGDVILLQGEENVVTGDTLIYNLTSREAKVIGTCQGRRCGDQGRVKILIKNTNDQSTEPSASSGTPAASEISGVSGASAS